MPVRQSPSGNAGQLPEPASYLVPAPSRLDIQISAFLKQLNRNFSLSPVEAPVADFQNMQRKVSFLWAPACFAIRIQKQVVKLSSKSSSQVAEASWNRVADLGTSSMMLPMSCRPPRPIVYARLPAVMRLLLMHRIGELMAQGQGKEGRKFTNPWQPTRLNGCNSICSPSA